jgi:hypothetical protein
MVCYFEGEKHQGRPFGLRFQSVSTCCIFKPGLSIFEALEQLGLQNFSSVIQFPWSYLGIDTDIHRLCVLAKVGAKTKT